MESAENKYLAETNVDISLPKVIGLGAIGVILAGAIGYSLNSWLTFKDFGSLQSLMALALAIVVFLAAFLLQTLFIKSRQISNAIILLESLAVSAVFLPYFSWLVLAAWALVFLGLLSASYRGQSEMDNLIRIKFFRIEKPVVLKAFTAIAVFIALIYFSGPNSGLGISQQSVRSLLKPSEPILRSLLAKNFSFDMTVYQFATAIIDSKIAANLGISSGTMPSSAKTLLINEGLAQLRAQAAPYGITFRNSDTLVDAVYNYLSRLLVKIPPKIQPLISVAAMLLIFLAIRSFGFLFHWASGILAYLLYELAIFTGFIRITSESRSREIIMLK